MHKARDHNKKEINAYSAEARPGGIYFCLCCGAPVTLRAKYSKKVKPHFGHLHWVASKEKCELYVQSNYDSWQHNTPLWPPFDGPISPPIVRKSAFTPTHNLYLKNDDGNWELFIVFKLLPWERKNSGHILISSLRGDYKIDSNAINFSNGKIKPLEIDFSFNKNCLHKSGSVDDELWNELTENFESISPINSIFNSPDGTGRKLGLHERLKKEQEYVYVSDSEVMDSKILDIFKERFKVDSVWIYTFEIKTSASYPQIEYLTSFFQREIVDSRPKFTLINLYPIDVETDGTYIIPPSTEFFCLQTESDELEVRSSKTFSKKEKLDDKTVKYYLDGIDDFRIMWHQFPEIRFEKRVHQNKDFDGFKVHINGIERNLIGDSKLDLKKFEIRFSDLNFDFKHTKVFLDGQRKYPKLDETITGISEHLILDAGCFGYFDSYDQSNLYDIEIQDEIKQEHSNLLKFLGLKLRRIHPDLDSHLINQPFASQRKYHLRKLNKLGAQYDPK